MPESDRVVISNTTPIVSLALIGKLDLLRMLYGKVWIPPAVKAELVAGGVRAGAREVDDVDYLRVATLVDPRRAGLLSDLDRGEAEVIALALEYKSPLVLMDERLGRRYAERVGLSVTGVLGVLLRAKKEGYLSSIKPLIVQLRQDGIRLGDTLVARALEMANEQ